MALFVNDTNNSGENGLSDTTKTYTGEEVAKTIIQSYIPPVQFMLGSFGGVISAVVMWKMLTQVTPLCLYLFLLAPLDPSLLFLESTLNWLAKVAGVDMYLDIISRSDTSCKVYHFLKHFTLHFSNWIIVSLAVETFRIKRRSPELTGVVLRHVIDVIVLLIVLLCCLNIHYFWTYGVVSVDIVRSGNMTREGHCMFNAKNMQGYQDDPVFGETLEIIDWIIGDAIPVIIILVISIGSYCMSHTSHGKRGIQLMSKGSSYQHLLLRNSQGDRKSRYKDSNPSGPLNELMDKTLMYLPVLFLLLSLPYIVWRPLDRYLLLRSQTKSDTGDAQAQWALAAAIFSEWRMTFYSTKIFLYTFTSQWFRRNLMSRLKPNKNRNPIQTEV